MSRTRAAKECKTTIELFRQNPEGPISAGATCGTDPVQASPPHHDCIRTERERLGNFRSTSDTTVDEDLCAAGDGRYNVWQCAHRGCNRIQLTATMV